MSTAMSGRDLVVVAAAAAALGGGLVALAFTVGGPRNPSMQSSSGDDECEETRVLGWRTFFPRSFSLQSGRAKGGENYTRSLSAQFQRCVQCSGCSSPEQAARQADNIAAENPALDGEDLGAGVNAGGLCSRVGDSAASTKPDPYDPSKRRGYMSWDDYFMAIAFLSARRSKDPNRQVGACIVSQDRVILGIGYNGFPRGCSDDELPWAKKSASGDPLQTKYPYVCHAEVNAILNKNHASATGQRLYVTLFPCNECAKIIIQAGIAEVVFYTDKGAHVENDAGSTEPAYVASHRLLSMAGIKAHFHGRFSQGASM